MKRSISIVIPSYNEEKRIEETLKSYLRFFNDKVEKKELGEFEIIVVINNTSDDSPKIIKEISKKNKELKVLEFERGGKGFAIIEGFKDSLKRNNSLIGFVDADMATEPEDFYDLILNIGGSKGIIASRWMKGSVIKNKQTFLRRFVSRGFNFIVRSFFLMNYRDTQCGAKVFRREALEKVIKEMKLTEWSFDVNLLYLCKKKGFKIKERPTVWSEKVGTKLNLKRVPAQMFLGVLRLRTFYTPFRKLIKIYDGLPSKFKIDKIK